MEDMFVGGVVVSSWRCSSRYCRVLYIFDEIREEGFVFEVFVVFLEVFFVGGDEF